MVKGVYDQRVLCGRLGVTVKPTTLYSYHTLIIYTYLQEFKVESKNVKAISKLERE